MSIAGSDSSGCGGVQADLRVFQALGVHGVCAITSVTAQNTQGLQRVYPLPPTLVAAQMDSVTSDMTVSSVKLGMMGRAEIIRRVAARLARLGIPHVILDPVLASKTGTSLLRAGGLEALRLQLLPRSSLVTPNAVEASLLTGMPVTDPDEARAAGARLVEMGAGAALVKGGHLAGACVDTLVTRSGVHLYEAERIGAGPANVRGTGCVLSASIAARLALGDDLPAACAFGVRFVQEFIRGAVPVGKGAWLGATGSP